MYLRGCLTAAAGVMLTTSLAFGLHAKLSLQEIAQNADLIFVGTVTRQNSHYNARRTAIETDVTFTDVRIEHQTERARQRGANTIQLTFAGGRVGDVSFGVSDSPSFETGRRYLVFMTDDGSRPVNPVVGADQGMFEVLADAANGAEYLMTRAGRAVVGIDDDGNLRSTSRPLDSIAAGAATFRTSIPSPIMTAPDPVPAGPGGIVEPRDESRVDATLDTPMTLDAFVDHVRNVSLQKKIDRPRLPRERRGVFYRVVDGTIVGLPIEERPLPTETIDDRVRQAGVTVAGNGAPESAAVSEGGVSASAWWYEPLMNCGRRQSWPFTMETPSGGMEFFAAYNNMLTFNNYVDLFRPIGAYPDWGWNGANEFIGYPSPAEFREKYGFDWSGLAFTVTVAIGGWCTTIIESDVMWSPYADWTDNFYLARQDIFLNDINTATMHELGHTVGLSRTLPEKYDYDYLTVMHGDYMGRIEDGRGLHAADAINLRANYGAGTNIADIGVESYYPNPAGSWLYDSALTSSVLGPPYQNRVNPSRPLRPGDPITANSVTVESMSPFAINNVHLRFYLSTDQIINSLDRQLTGADWSWSTFWGDSYWVGTLTANVPFDTPPGTYWFGARTSINGYQGDGYSGNNSTFFTDRVTISCDGMFAISPASSSVLKGGLSSVVTLSTLGTACPWTAASSDTSWLHLTTTSGTGPGTISYSVDANLTNVPRSATISAAGTSHVVSQEAGCVVSTATPISMWTTTNGSLSTSNCLSSQRELSAQRPYAARYSFSGTAGRAIAIYLWGNFNTYVYLLDPSGAVLAHDDNGATFGNSRIPAVNGFLTLPSTGTYTIEVTSASVGATGAFGFEVMSSVTLTVSPDPVAGSCRNAQGKIVLGAPAPTGGTTVSLHKPSTFTAATLPATVTVPAGATSRGFTITTAAVTADQTGTVVATWGSSGDAYGADSLTIRPIQPKSLVLSPASVVEGSSSMATMTLECAAGPGGITLALSSSKPLRAQPASSTLTIPGGSANASFLVHTFDVSSTSTASIKAAANGKTKSATLTINPIF